MVLERITGLEIASAAKSRIFLLYPKQSITARSTRASRSRSAASRERSSW